MIHIQDRSLAKKKKKVCQGLQVLSFPRYKFHRSQHKWCLTSACSSWSDINWWSGHSEAEEQAVNTTLTHMYYHVDKQLPSCTSSSYRGTRVVSHQYFIYIYIYIYIYIMYFCFYYIIVYWWTGCCVYFLFCFVLLFRICCIFPNYVIILLLLFFIVLFCNGAAGLCHIRQMVPWPLLTYQLILIIWLDQL